MKNLIRRLKKAREKREKEEENSKGSSNSVILNKGDIKALGSLKSEEEEKEEEDEEEAVKDNKKIDFPKNKKTLGGGIEGEEEDKLLEREIERKYPLIPKDPKKGDTVYAWAYITYDEGAGELIYKIIEPELSEHRKDILEEVEEILKSSIDVDFGELKKDSAADFLNDKVREILNSYDFNLTNKDRKVIQYYAYRDFIGLDKIEPLMNDREIEDISCDGVDIPIYAYHRDPQIGSVKTTVKFEEKDKLDSFVMKLSQRCGRSISVAEPLLDGSLSDGSRVQSTLGTDISRRGSNFTIRRFTEEPLTPVHMMNFGTVNAEMLAYFWLAVEHGKSILIVGPTAAGKTSLLNALSLFIRPEMKIVSIEDTPELRLPHPHWVPEVARSGFGFGESKSGEVTLDDLLKESLRQRPDYIIVGEVRGAEAYILFQQIATGHPGMSTLHASSIEKVMDRLTTKPINLPPTLIENLDAISFIKRLKRNDSYVRRVQSVLELEGYNREKQKSIVNKVFQWEVKQDKFEEPGKSTLLAEIVDDSDLSKRDVQKEILKRKKILNWMQEQNIMEYKKVGRVISAYYSDSSALMDKVEGW